MAAFMLCSSLALIARCDGLVRGGLTSLSSPVPVKAPAVPAVSLSRSADRRHRQSNERQKFVMRFSLQCQVVQQMEEVFVLDDQTAGVITVHALSEVTCFDVI